MKKNLLIVAAAALVLAGCTDSDILKKDINERNSVSDGAINFNAFTEKVTRAENSTAPYTQTFYNHQESFQVWARKSNQPNQEIFGGTKVIVEKSGANYTYTYAPERFWDKLAPKYHFYAAAPARTTADDWYWTFHGEGITSDATLNKGYFSIDKKFTLNEVNLKHKDNGGADGSLEKVFKNVQVSSTDTKKDVDLLIAAPAEVTQTYYNIATPNAVNLNFIHILSKLNVTIKTSLGTVTPTDGSEPHTYDVKLLAFEIKNVPNVGKFSENPNYLTTSNNKQIRWRLINSESNKTGILTGIKGLDNDNNITADAISVPYGTSGKYIVESLFIPQEIKYQRVALDGIAHDIIDSDEAVPYASYQAYQEAKNNNGTLSLDQFEALIDGNAFVTWANYDHEKVPGETDNRIKEAKFNERVALATKTTEQGTAPYSDYTEFATAKAPLTQDQFNALISTNNNEVVFVDWDNYTQIEGEDIDAAEFNSRVTLATNTDQGTAPYSDYTEFITAKAPLTQTQFSALLRNGAFVEWEEYNHTLVPGETDMRIDRAIYNSRVAEASNTDETFGPTYPEPSEPYFTIKYSIDGEIFEASYNLAAAFKNMSNNEFENDGVTDKNEKFAFYEGWQNTLNITINPSTIQFTAEVAEWADDKNVDFTVESGNE